MKKKFNKILSFTALATIPLAAAVATPMLIDNHIQKVASKSVETQSGPSTNVADEDKIKWDEFEKGKQVTQTFRYVSQRNDWTDAVLTIEANGEDGFTWWIEVTDNKVTADKADPLGLIKIASRSNESQVLWVDETLDRASDPDDTDGKVYLLDKDSSATQYKYEMTGDDVRNWTTTAQFRLQQEDSPGTGNYSDIISATNVSKFLEDLKPTKSTKIPWQVAVGVFAGVGGLLIIIPIWIGFCKARKHKAKE